MNRASGSDVRVEEAAKQYTKRWFDKEKGDVAKRRALEVQNAQQLYQDADGPKALGGGGGGRGVALKEA